jgi:hypothetical protein
MIAMRWSVRKYYEDLGVVLGDRRRILRAIGKLNVASSQRAHVLDRAGEERERRISGHGKVRAPACGDAGELPVSPVMRRMIQRLAQPCGPIVCSPREYHRPRPCPD